MAWSVETLNSVVDAELEELDMLARFEPHVKHLSGPLWEVRVFIKKTQKTPNREVELALRRAKEIAQ